MASQHVEICVGMENRGTGTNRDRSNQTVDELAWSLSAPAADAGEGRGFFEVGWLG